MPILRGGYDSFNLLKISAGIENALSATQIHNLE